MKEHRISIIGLGKLGMPLCAVLASKGFYVTGVDCDEELVSLLNQGKTRVSEPGLQELLDENQHYISATTDFNSAILNSDISFIIVPTPSDANGLFSNDFVLQAMRDVGCALHNKLTYHLIVIVSTVMPGSTNNEIRQTIETHSQRTIGKNIGLCYSPEFIALGDIIKNMLYPDMVLIGESDSRAGTMLENIYKMVCENNSPIVRMNLINAEITKISVNTFVTTKISFANMLSDLCDRLPGADVNTVTEAMGLDSRIGTKYLKGATAYGGPCFPRDNIAFATFARYLGARADIAEAADAINNYQLQRIIAIIDSYGKKKRVGILGLSYKPHTPVIEESTGVKLANLLSQTGYAVSVYDPMAMTNAKNELNNAIVSKSSVETCVADSDILVIATDWPEFREQLDTILLARSSASLIIIDCWRILAEKKYPAVSRIHYLGSGEDDFYKDRGQEWKKSIKAI